MSGDIISHCRRRLAREKGTVRKDRGGRLPVALVYPGFYRMGMSNLGFQLVYHLLNRRPDVAAERVFLPEGQEMSLYLQSGKPLLSLETQTPLRNFHLVAFSLSFENDYLYLLKILEMGKIPLLREARTGPDPYVMAGGVTTFLNPEPLADFMDFFLLGEAEANLDPFIDAFIGLSSRRSRRKDVIRELAVQVPSLYAPGLYRPGYHGDGTLAAFHPVDAGLPETVRPARPTGSGFSSSAVPVSAVTTPDTEFKDKILVELGRGCGRSCRFCAAGYIYRPPRPRSPAALLDAVEKALQRSPRLGLLAPAVSDIPGVEAVTARIVEKGGRFSVSSLRADTVSEALLADLKAVDQKTLAIAPEAGTGRLRRVINKHLSREQITEAVTRISAAGSFSLRLYFLIGLPTETREDITGIADLAKMIRHHMVRASAPRGTVGRIRLSVNCFVPKPFTPFQWFSLDRMDILKEKQKRIRKVLAREGGIRVSSDLPKWAYVQALLSMGDRRVGRILLKAHRLGGRWFEAFRFSDVNPDFFVYRPRALDERLPWDFIDHGILKKHLADEYRLALAAVESEVCRVGKCRRCGVCRTEA